MTSMTGGAATSLTHMLSPSWNQEVSFAWRKASMLPCSVPAAALVKPGSSNMTHEPSSISARLRVTSSLSVSTSISVPAFTVLRSPLILNSLPLRTSAMGGCGARRENSAARWDRTSSVSGAFGLRPPIKE